MTTVSTWPSQEALQVEKEHGAFLVGNAREGIVRMNPGQTGDHGSQGELIHTPEMLDLIIRKIILKCQGREERKEVSFVLTHSLRAWRPPVNNR